MKHVRPVSKAIIGQSSMLLNLLQLLISLGILDIREILKKDGDGA